MSDSTKTVLATVGVKVINVGHAHHLGHASAAFYNSGFEDAAAVIVDGAGTRIELPLGDQGDVNPGFETESIFNCNYDEGIKAVFTSFGGNPDTRRVVDENFEMDHTITLVKAYEAVSEYLRAIKSDKNFIQTYEPLGNLFLKQGNKEDALTIFRSLLTIEPDYPQRDKIEKIIKQLESST